MAAITNGDLSEPVNKPPGEAGQSGFYACPSLKYPATNLKNKYR
jgi:hypothetical protein